MPLLASAAVMLSVAMELITWSVMGGFLDQLIQSGRSLMGDIEIARPQIGFAHYDELIRRLEADEWVQAATPTVDAFGLVSLEEGQISSCLIKGIEPESYDRVTGYFGTLYWTPRDEPLPHDTERLDPRLQEENREALQRFKELGETLEGVDFDTGGVRPQAVLGLEVFGKRDMRDPGGFVRDFPIFIPGLDVTLNVLPLDRRGGFLEPIARKFQVANEFSSGIYEIDSRTIYLPLATLQDMMKMDEAERVKRGARPTIEYDEQGNPTGVVLPAPVGIDPARVTSVLVRADGDVPLEDLKARVAEIYEQFATDIEGVPPGGLVRIVTWEDRNSTLIGAIRKETALVLFIFGIISLTSVFLVLAIFWSMISERTKDVGILRAVGASRLGVAWLWVRYGLVIGIVGSVSGVVLAYVVITNINAIHEWMGAALGIYIWDPKVYYFTRIPSDFNVTKAIIIGASGIVSCAIGAVIPAWRAARMDPVRALRFE